MTAFEAILSDEFEGKFIFYENAIALHDALLRDESVQNLRDSIKSESITWNDLSKLVDLIVSKFRAGVRLDNETALCAIAVAIEEMSSPFSEEFLEKLSQLRAAEIRRAIAVARECKIVRANQPRTTMQKVVLPESEPGELVIVEFNRPSRPSISPGNEREVYYA